MHVWLYKTSPRSREGIVVGYCKCSSVDDIHRFLMVSGDEVPSSPYVLSIVDGSTNAVPEMFITRRISEGVALRLLEMPLQDIAQLHAANVRSGRWKLVDDEGKIVLETPRRWLAFAASCVLNGHLHWVDGDAGVKPIHVP